jgi:FixJ family two-component response regulator
MSAAAERSIAARILVLDDEDTQRRTIHHQLAELGGFVDFGDPREAIAYLRLNEVDAVVVDIRMPKLPVDGLWFLAQLREFDKDLGVVLRTGDADVSIAQAGIEARAIQRVIKGEPNARMRLRAAVQTAVEETRTRRREVAAVAEAERTRGELLIALGRLDDEISVAEMCRGFVQGLTNHVTALAGYSELFVEHASATRDTALAELAAKNRVAASRLSGQVTEFLGNPYLEGTLNPLAVAGANACVEALQQIFRNHSLFGAGKRAFNARGALPDALFVANPTRTLTALRHLVEYCALRVKPGGVVGLNVTVCANGGALLAASKNALVINGRSASTRPNVVFVVQTELGSPPLEVIRRELRQCSSDPRVGNLLMVGAAIIDDHMALGVSHSAKGLTTFQLYIPTNAAFQ